MNPADAAVMTRRNLQFEFPTWGLGAKPDTIEVVRWMETFNNTLYTNLRIVAHRKEEVIHC